jgi:hypothetical protein
MYYDNEPHGGDPDPRQDINIILSCLMIIYLILLIHNSKS